MSNCPYTWLSITIPPFGKGGLGGICGDRILYAQTLNPPQSPFFKGGSKSGCLSSYSHER